jgi:hypothetical protein
LLVTEQLGDRSGLFGRQLIESRLAQVPLVQLGELPLFQLDPTLDLRGDGGSFFHRLFESLRAIPKRLRTPMKINYQAKLRG